MAFSDVALLASDPDFTQRVAACAAIEKVLGDPSAWASGQRWAMAAMPGFGDAYASALASGVERPGWDAAVITDAQILSAVQAISNPGE
jgi:hypothetical protein